MDERGLAELLERHGGALVLYARQFCAAPEDVVQDALVKLCWQRRLPTPLLPWLYRVVRNRAISAGRSDQRRRRHETRAAELQQPWFQQSHETDLDAATVVSALQALPAREREVVTLHLWAGLTFGAIAGVLGCSSSTAHRAYQAALERLRERILPCPRVETHATNSP